MFELLNALSEAFSYLLVNHAAEVFWTAQVLTVLVFGYALWVKVRKWWRNFVRAYSPRRRRRNRGRYGRG